MEYAIDVAKACRQYGIQSVAVTNGYICEKPREEFFQYMDAANVDLKAFTESFYQKITYSHLQPVLDTLVYIKHHTNVWLEITTLLIPGKNDSVEELEKLAQWVVKELGPDVPIHFTAFHPAWKMMNLPSTPLETLVRARNIAIKNGVRYAYTGNIHNIEGDSTYCHQCHKCIIKRDWYEIVDYQLTHDGKCKFCNTQCSGVFEGPPGTWGQKQQPINI